MVTGNEVRDTVIVGGGHNGLVCAWHLARAEGHDLRCQIGFLPINRTSYLKLGSGLERTQAEFVKFSHRDAEVLGRMILSPLDLERRFGLTSGHGHLSLDQPWAASPILGHASYRAPVKGLYMCGAGTHPGDGVSGNPGRNAARKIRRDRSLPTAIGLALQGH